MRESIDKGRLYEEWRQAALDRILAADDLIRHQNSVAELAATGRATAQDRQGLAEAMRLYDGYKAIERIADAKLRKATNE